MPQMILQPIIENAVFHGIEPKEENGHIVVRSFVEGEQVHISIKDDGIGISQNKLIEIRHILDQDLFEQHQSSSSTNATEYLHKEGIGLVNVNSRLILRYGRSNKLKVESVDREGTSILFKLPLLHANQVMPTERNEKIV